MQYEWKFGPMPLPGVNLETHWYETLGRYNGPRHVAVRLNGTVAGHLAERYAKVRNIDLKISSIPSKLDDVLAKILDNVILSQDLFSVLIAFVRAQEEHDPMALVPSAGGSIPQFGSQGDLTATILLKPDAVGLLNQLSGTEGFEVLSVGDTIDERFATDGRVASPEEHDHSGDATVLEGDEIIIGIVDDGIAFANDRFRSGIHSTRIEYFWAMDAPIDTTTPVELRTASQGRTLKKRHIDQMLAQFDGMEEQRIYTATKLVDHSLDKRQPLKHRWSHGTHVLDIAAGYDWTDATEYEKAVKRPIVAVQLPTEVVADTAGSFTAAYLDLALSRIRENAEHIAKRIGNKKGTKSPVYLPLVVNFSFGVFAGPKDGADRIDPLKSVEGILDKFIREYERLPGNPPCFVVLPAGNGFNSRTTAYHTVGPDRSIMTLGWRLQPDDRTPGFVHVWGPPPSSKTDDSDPDADGQQFEVALLPPGARETDIPESQWSRIDEIRDGTIDGKFIVRLYHHRDHLSAAGREHVLIAVSPTSTDGNPDNRCPSGLWTICVRNHGFSPEVSIEFQVQRDDPIHGQRLKARPSYFDDKDYLLFDPITGRPGDGTQPTLGPVSREGTVNAYAGTTPYEKDSSDNPGIVVVGGYRRSDGIPARYTASGPTLNRAYGPDLAAVSDESPSDPGVLAAGTYSGTVFAQRGTSVAAPAITRLIADQIAENRTEDPMLTVIDDVKRNESSGLNGPHGKYASIERNEHLKLRFGAGRLGVTTRAGHRRRIDP